MQNYESNEIQKIQRERSKVFRDEQKNKFLIRSRGITNENEDISVEKMKELNDELRKLRFKDANAEKRLGLLSQIRIGTCFGEDYIKPCLRAIMHSIIHSLKVLKHSQCQLEAAACLTNFSVGNHQITSEVANKSGPFLIEFISCSNPQLQVQCIWAVTNICNDCEACFLILKQYGLISSLLGQLESPYPEVVEYVMISLTACTRYKDNHLEISSIIKLTNHLLSILKSDSSNQPSHKYVLHILSNIYPEIIGVESRTFGSEVFNIALQCFTNTVSKKELDVQVATACIRCFGIATAFSNDFCTTLATNKEFGSCVFKVLKCRYGYLKKELLWVLINVFASVDIETPDFFVDLQHLIHHIVPFVCPFNDKIFMAMQLLCTLLAKDEKCKQLVDDRLRTHVHVLQQYNRKDLKNMAHVFNMLTGNETF